jgi:hypothetical protein
MALSLKDRIEAETKTLLDSFANLISSARVPDGAAPVDPTAGAPPGELMQVFSEKILQVRQALRS